MSMNVVGVGMGAGCYIGQETIARLITYDGVKQQLWKVEVDGEVAVGAAVTLEGKKVGGNVCRVSRVGVGGGRERSAIESQP